MKKSVGFTLGALLLSGCATSSGVLPFGKDTFTITATNHFTRGGAPGAQTSAIQQANAHCSKSGLLMSPVSTQTTQGVEDASYQMVFRCLAEDDPEYTRPDWGAAPDVVIENRQ